MTRHIFSFIGTTAGGKTKTALAVAEGLIQRKKASGVVILSADSRQVYQGLEVITGCDIPLRFKRNSVAKIAGKNYFECGNTILTGLSCCDVSQDWSVAHFQEFAQRVLAWTDEQNWLLFVVGGTGLYHQQILKNDSKLHTQPNAAVRAWASDAPLTMLQGRLQELDPVRFTQMNHSDQNNPIRLIRAIEQAISTVEYVYPDRLLEATTQHYIGIFRTADAVQTAISERVKERFLGDAQQEVAWLQQQKNVTPQAASTLGVPELQLYQAGKISADECLTLWAQHEWQYAKRQLTWWKKLSDCNWYSGEPQHHATTVAQIESDITQTL